ncbi:MAG: DUF1292 domain-containing protein [Acetilactobacillus jinshanensis]
MSNLNSNQQISLTDKDGRKVIYNVLLTFKSDDFHKSYILIYPQDRDKSQQVGVRAFSLPPNEDPANPQSGDLRPIKTKQEWDMVESVLNTFVNPDK